MAVCKEYDAPYPGGQYLYTLPPFTFFGPVHEMQLRSDYTVVLVPSSRGKSLLVWVNVSKGYSRFADMVDTTSWIAAGWCDQYCPGA